MNFSISLKFKIKYVKKEQSRSVYIYKKRILRYIIAFKKLKKKKKESNYQNGII